VFYVALGAVVALVVAVALAGAGGGGSKRATTTTVPLGTGVCKADTKMDVYSSPPHTDTPAYRGPLTPRNNPTYTVNPPSGGDHLSAAVPPGIYTGSKVPPDGNLVHSLEHGYVIIWFQPGLVDQVRPVYDSAPRDVLLVERANMDTPVAATAWGHRLLCSAVDVPQLEAFVQQYVNKGPEAIPH
jgi:hypothetical protein